MASVSVSIKKAKATREIDLDKVPEGVYLEALRLGLEEMANRGTSKLGAAKGLEGAELDKYRAAALEIAERQITAILEGTIKVGRKSGTSKVSGAVMTEARRIARNIVKDEIKKAGGKISHYEASEITKAANALIEADPSILETAKANLEARTTAPVKLDITKLVKESPKLVERAEKAKAERKTQLSAKQAGKVATRAKGKPAEATLQ